MRIIIKNSNRKNRVRELIVKVLYDETKPIVKTQKDQYGRLIVTTWKERKTTVSAREYFQEAKNDKMTVYYGTTVCDYRDAKQFNKKTGRCIAWMNCIDELYNHGVINEHEADMLDMIELDATSFEIDMDKHTVSKKY